MGMRVRAGIIVAAIVVVAGCNEMAVPNGVDLANNSAPTPPPAVPSPEAAFTQDDGTTELPELDDDDVFTDLAVCGEEAFDEDAASCDEDQAGALDRVSTVYCSASATGASEPVIGELVLDDVVIQTSSATVNPDTVRPVWFGFELDDAPLPGGQWACLWRVEGESDEVVRPFPIPGPRGELVDTYACDGDDTNEAGMCPTPSTDAAEHVERIACSATLVALDGASLQVDLHDPYGLAASAEPVTVDGPLTTFVATFSAGEEPFGEGSHTCIWQVDDEPSASAELDVS